MKYVTVRFDGIQPKQYHYMCSDPTVQEGDYFVVFPRAFPSVVQVIGVQNLPITKATKILGPKIDRVSYEIEMNTLAEIKELQSSIDAEVKQIQEREFYDYVARTNPKVKAMLGRLDKLTS